MKYEDYKVELTVMIRMFEKMFQERNFQDASCGRLKWYHAVQSISVYDTDTMAWRPLITSPFELQDKAAQDLHRLYELAVENSEVSDDKLSVLDTLREIIMPMKTLNLLEYREGEVTNEH